MKRKILSGLLASLTIATATTSCSEDHKYEYNTSNECLITAVTMGALKRAMHTTDSLGADSTYYVSVTGALYPMSIDQSRQRIFNVDSLPYGTDISKVVFSSINSIGTYSIRSLHSGNDTIFTLSDSTDFRKSRIITVYATDGKTKREYMMSINVHQEEGDSMNWHRVEQAAVPFADLQQTRSLTVGHQLYLFGVKGNDTHLLCANTENYDNGSTTPWFSTTTSIAIRPQSVVYFQNQFYAVDAQGHICLSTDGANWTPAATDFTASTLVVAGSQQLIALKDRQFYSSPDGINWTKDLTDENHFLPDTLATGTKIVSKIDSHFESLLVVGTSQGKNVVWRREIDLTGNEIYPWVYLPESASSNYNIPNVRQFSVNNYDGVAMLSGLTADGKVAPLLLSRDNGRTWKKDLLKTPAATAANSLAVSVDAANFIWMFCGSTGEIWRGRLNRLGWEEIPGIFEKSGQFQH